METGFGETATAIERFRFQLRQLFDTFQWIPRSERTIALLATREFVVEIEFLITCDQSNMGHSTGMPNVTNALVEKPSGKIFTNLEPITSSFDNLDLAQLQADSVILQAATLDGAAGCIDETDSSMSVCRRLTRPQLLEDDDDDGSHLDDMVSPSHSQLIDAVYSEMRHQASLMTAAESCCGVPALLSDDHRSNRAPSEAGSDAFLELSTFAADMQNSAKDLLDTSDVLSKDLVCETAPSAMNSFQSQVCAKDLTSEVASNLTTTIAPESENSASVIPQQRITRSMLVHTDDEVAPLTLPPPPPSSSSPSPNSERQTSRESRKRLSRGKVLRTGKRMDRLLAARRQQGAKRLKENNATAELASETSSSSKSLGRKRPHRRKKTSEDSGHEERRQDSGGNVSCRSCRTEFSSSKLFSVHKCAVSSDNDLPIYSCVLCEQSSSSQHHPPHEHSTTAISATLSPPPPPAPNTTITTTTKTVTHPRNTPGDRRFFECSQCDRKFAKRVSLYVHLRRHVCPPRVVCLKCGLVCEDEAHHGRHVLVHARKPKFRCAKCGEGFDRRQQYDQHLRGHFQYDCSLCDPSQPLATKQQTLRHRRQVHGILTRQERRHECKECRARFTRPALLEAHLRLVHLGEQPSRPKPCPLCGKRLRSASALTQHLDNHSDFGSGGGSDELSSQQKRKSRSSTNGPPMLCAKCGATFDRNQDLLRHMQQRHSEEKKFECPFCDFRCKCKTNLKRHIELHKDEKRFVCELCGASFNAHATLKDHHAYVHSEARSFVCPSCNKGFKGRSGLRRHLRSHSDARPYACQCGQAYKRMSHLKRHMVALHNVVFKSQRVQRLAGGPGGVGEDDLTLSEDDLIGTLDHVLSGGVGGGSNAIATLDLDSVQPLLDRIPMPGANQCPMPAVAGELDFGDDDDDVAAQLAGVSMSTGPLPSMSQLSAGFLSDNLAQFLSMH